MTRAGAAGAWRAGLAAILLSLISAAPLHADDKQDHATSKDTKSSGARAVATPVKLQKASQIDCPTAPPFATDANGKFSYRDCADTPELVRLLGATFDMGEHSTTGTTYERPIHSVTVAGFSIGKYEVTFDEWDACYRAGACLKQADDKGWGRGRRPVIDVSWIDAQQYVHWLSEKSGHHYRLPSEAEWEYASRAGTGSRFSWGDGAEWACESANVFDLTSSESFPNWHWRASCDDGFVTTAPVGSFKGNPWGLFDMSGNVWEWVQDCWHNDYTGAPADGSAWVEGGQCSKRVNRGGGWGNHPRSMRSASRDADNADGYSNAIGFRVVRDP